MVNYSREAAVGGKPPAAYVSEPTDWPFTGLPSLHCEDLNMWQDDGTPIICTGGPPYLFYFADGLDKKCPSCDFASRIETVAKRHKPPFFLTTYGGLHWTSAAQEPKKEFWTLLHDTMSRLGDDYVAIGAQEMARLSRQARGNGAEYAII